jgi:hypothetical protein
MTKQKTSSGCKKENATESRHELSAEECEPEDHGNSDQGGQESQPTLKPNSDIDDGGPLSI